MKKAFFIATIALISFSARSQTAADTLKANIYERAASCLKKGERIKYGLWLTLITRMGEPETYMLWTDRRFEEALERMAAKHDDMSQHAAAVLADWRQMANKKAP